MCEHAAFFLELGRMPRGVVGQEPDEFVTEEMAISLPLASIVHGLESSNLERPVAKIGSGLKPIELPPHGHARFLHHHFSVVQIGQQRSQERVDRRFVSNEQGHELFVFRGLRGRIHGR